ncbi:MAG: hypothetical protein A3J27_10035 [Candidatus Tectomicrobia bacterium RIFCSPLOWO2_12_FULL_69_37]|nr:MAG: hypothetical protein A3I72_02860 [Candidatus Tectomicrobia bacterium RIFCSPLOWO2_02_FULL_70_19]OGL69472.1 MAG: hypothetical protein A3J27_10035 [Candidatus Tectomicrobia bacterium RIFCSPLOWO2_12_FULL_69_37]
MARVLRVIHTEASRGLGGQEKRILLEAVSLRERGHGVLLVGQPDGLLRREAERAGVPFRSVRMRFVCDPAALWGLLRVFRGERPDIVHTHSSKDSWLAGVAGRLLGLTVVRTRHVSIPVSGHRLNWAYRLPHLIMTTAERIRRMLVEGGLCEPSRVKVLPTGVDLARFREGIPPRLFREELALADGVPAVGIVAQLRKSKGHGHFLQAARRLRDGGSNARFFVVGDGHWRDIFREEARGLGVLDGTVAFLGYREDIPEVMAGLDLLVIASTRTEGVPQVALQAMAMGLPIVGTDVGGVPEVLLPSGAGVVVPAGDPRALAAAVQELLADPARRARMGEAGRAYVRERHSLERMLEETVHAYEEVLASCAR